MALFQNLKKTIRRTPWLYRCFLHLRRVLRPGAVDPVQLPIARLLRGRREVFFVQVGSNDGLQTDPLHSLIVTQRHWSGIFIEPVPYLFERLKRNYGADPRFTFENVAIGDASSDLQFYYVSEKARSELPDVPVWYDQLGSFDRDHILKHMDGKLEPFIIEERVECASLGDIIARNNVERIDLLHIDTEGFDYQVLAQIDFDCCCPEIILFEHKHLSAEDKQNALSLLEGFDYATHDYGSDTLAVHSSCTGDPDVAASSVTPRVPSPQA